MRVTFCRGCGGSKMAAVVDEKKGLLNLERLVRPNILNLVPYRCARDDFSEGVLLDANECSYGSSIPVDGDMNRYPCPYQLELKQMIADFRGVQKEHIFTGVGSDDAIDMIVRVFCKPGRDSILITPPTYGMYKVVANINDVNAIDVPLTGDFELRVQEILKAITPTTHVIFLCSPNNPTGNNIGTEDIVALLDSCYQGIVVVDEAYVDFSEKPSLCYLLKKYPRLIILQTLSKSFGLAGIRFGVAIAHPDIISIFNKVKFPYNINKLTSKVAEEAYSKVHLMKKIVEKIQEQKKRVVGELGKFPTVRKIFPSDSNFLLVRIDHALETYKALADQGVIVRYRGNQPHCQDCIRITIGTPEENNALLNALRIVVGKFQS